MEFNKKEILVSEEIKPLWKLIIASLFYVFTAYFFCLTIHYWSIRWISYGLECLQFSLLLLSGALFFSLRRLIYLNTEKKLLKVEYRVGNIKFNFTEITDLNYISVFNNKQTENVEVNLWYKKNKHLNITNFDDLNLALECGRKFSEKLNLDLLDATIKGNSKWVKNQIHE